MALVNNLSMIFGMVIVFSQAVLVICTTKPLKGCSFDVPYELMRNPSPVVEGTPLLFEIDIHIIGLSDVPNSGGSFGLNAEYVKKNIYLEYSVVSIEQSVPD